MRNKDCNKDCNKDGLSPHLFLGPHEEDGVDVVRGVQVGGEP